MYDYIVVGAGLFGCVMARRLKDLGKDVLIVERRDHIGGNCYSYWQNGVDIHKYGLHIFHTEDRHLWDWMQRWGEFERFNVINYSEYKGRLYNIPINKKTIQDMGSLRKAKRILIKKYSEKFWGMPFKDIPQSTIDRVPIRDNYYDGYYPAEHVYQGLPKYGWGNWFRRITLDIDIDFTNTGNFKTKKVIYTGDLDAYFDYKYGHLRWQGLIHQLTCPGKEVGKAVIFHPKWGKPVRSYEFKHIHQASLGSINIGMNEYAMGSGKYYPVDQDCADAIIYRQLAKKEKNVIFGGRLGTYRYLNMDETVKEALNVYIE
jgi:UDP-galactopyranose mutase